MAYMHASDDYSGVLHTLLHCILYSVEWDSNVHEVFNNVIGFFG